jgi:ariadne-1
MARMWMEKLQGESETANWVTANTKPCPTCHKPVEKNGGCNHVTCTCGQVGRWLC